MSANKISHILFGLIIAISLVSIWNCDIFPFQDWYDWLLQSKITYDLWSKSGSVSEWYSFAPHLFTIPNTFLTLILAVLQYLISAPVAGKVIFSIYAILLPLSVYKTVSHFSPHSPFRYAGAAWIHNYFFAMGFLNYLFGIILCIFFLPRILHRKAEGWKLTGEILFSSLLLYGFHGFPFGVFVLLWGFTVCRDLFQKRWDSVVPVILGLLPSLLLLGTYLVTNSNNDGETLGLYESLSHFLRTMAAPILPMHRYTPFETELPISIINAIAVTVISSLILLSCKRERIFREHLPVILPLIAIYLCSPIACVGNFYPPNQRFFPIVMVLILSVISFRKRIIWMELVVLSTALFLTVTESIHLNNYSRTAVNHFTELPELRPGIKRFTMGYVAVEEMDRRLSKAVSIPIKTTMRLGNLAQLDSLTVPTAIQETGIIRCGKDLCVDPDSLTCGRELTTFQEQHSLYENRLNALYDELLFLVPPATQKVVLTALSPRFAVADSSEQWILLVKK